MDIKTVIIDLCRASGVSGSEEPAVNTAKKYLEKYADVKTDSICLLFSAI